MKHEWRKQEKALYLPGTRPQELVVPPLRFFSVDGQGSPDSPVFRRNIECLYTLSYAVRMMPKQGHTPPGYLEYTVYPLEGLWDVPGTWDKTTLLDKSRLTYRLMIRQPDFVTADVAERALETARKKKPELPLDAVEWTVIEDGPSLQLLHIGPYADEPRSFGLLNDYAERHGLIIHSGPHREIYLGDPRKTEPATLKTVLRVLLEH